MTTETISSVHITGCVSASLSEPDKTSAMIVFMVGSQDGAPDRKFAITLPAQQLVWLRGIVHDLTTKALKANVAAGSVLMHGMENFAVGSSEQLPGKVIFIVDPGLQTESMIVMDNMKGLEVAEAIKKDIEPRLTSQQKANASIIKPRGIIAP